MLLRKYIETHATWNKNNAIIIYPPIHLLKYLYLKISFIQNNISKLLLLINEYISPKVSLNSKTFEINVFWEISVKGQWQIDSIVFKSTPLLKHPLSHRETFGKNNWSLNFKGISLLFGDL